MKDDEEDIELIEAYLRGTLDDQALAAFQRRRHDDPEFDREVIDYSQIINQIRTTQFLEVQRSDKFAKHVSLMTGFSQ